MDPPSVQEAAVLSIPPSLSYILKLSPLVGSLLWTISASVKDSLEADFSQE